ncbi:OmpA/MotB family protein [Sphingomonas sp. 22176]|uniref:OmpA/MotB family protein n=1 Tax=Sphingomonas sp. 22176 TaxID=3453884 RepID=UPI003F87C939
MILEEAIEHTVEEENYFISMTDMMVGLVFIFIVLLMYFALQFRDVTEQLSGADKTRTEILKQLEQTLKSKGVQVTIDTQNGVLRLPDAILFDSARAELKPAGQVAIGHLAEALNDVLPCYTDLPDPKTVRPARCPDTPHRIESLYIEGHTDDVPLTAGFQFKDNWDLSVVRATNTYRALVGMSSELGDRCARKKGECDPILSVSGYGPKRPVMDMRGTPDERRQRDRRIDLRILMVTPDSGQTVRAVAERLARK